MCKLCVAAKSSADYGKLMESMQESDAARLEFSKLMANEMKAISTRLYSSIKYPVKLVFPMFEARTAFSVPNNYFQPVMLSAERAGQAFAHGAMRSIFFSGNRLMLLSKTVNHKDGKEFFTSFILAHFDLGEFSYSFNGDEFAIKVDMEKSMRNLISDEMEKKRISFNFVNKAVKGRIISREQVLTSAQFKNVYSKYGGAMSKSSSIDMEGYAITVPHFSPHPYMLQLHGQFGYASNREFQEHAIDYFREHLSEKK